MSLEAGGRSIEAHQRGEDVRAAGRNMQVEKANGDHQTQNPKRPTTAEAQ